MRKNPFVNGEYYHVFTRGIDKRETFSDFEDVYRFLQSMEEFNVIDPIGSIFENSFRKDLNGKIPKKKRKKLVNFICYCVNPNHYHLLLEQVSDDGIRKFMQRLGTGYTKYFNNKHKRTGALFQGPFKSVHIDSNEYLLHLSAYINLNNRVHQLGSETSKLVKSSWKEYLKKSKKDFCKKGIILSQFNSNKEYENFAKNSLKDIQERKEIEKLLLEK